MDEPEPEKPIIFGSLPSSNGDRDPRIRGHARIGGLLARAIHRALGTIIGGIGRSHIEIRARQHADPWYDVPLICADITVSARTVGQADEARTIVEQQGAPGLMETQSRAADDAAT